jgi:hypothetical protein
MEIQNTNPRFFAFLLSNACVAVFFDGFWLLGYRIAAFDRLSEAMGYFQFVLWFACFFGASFLTLRSVIQNRLAARCCGLALTFSFLLYLLLGFSTALFGPYLDPWW